MSEENRFGDIHIGDNIQVGGQGNVGKIVHQGADGYRAIADALRTDAASASGTDGIAARAYADDLDEALTAGDPTRIDRVIGRIKELLSLATSAFALTRGLPPLD